MNFGAERNGVKEEERRGKETESRKKINKFNKLKEKRCKRVTAIP
jgi:hypothetical protein